jgi:hypothetical protein
MRINFAASKIRVFRLEYVNINIVNVFHKIYVQDEEFVQLTRGQSETKFCD